MEFGIVQEPLVAGNGTAEKKTKRSEELTRRESWRVSVLLGALAAFTVLVANVAVLIWLKASFGTISGIVTVYAGSCTKTKTTIIWTGLAINILSTSLLAASNNCAQLLSSPTRDDIDRAHSCGKWMDIGIPSIRNILNVWRTSPWRAALCLLLFLSSIPLHLLYNSAIFDSISVVDYHTLLVTEDFVSGGWWMYANSDMYDDGRTLAHEIEQLQSLAATNSSQLTRLSDAQCIQTYGSPSIFRSHLGDILLVTSVNQTNGMLAYWDNIQGGNLMTWMICHTWSPTDDCGPADSWNVSAETQCAQNIGISNVTDCGAVDAPIKYCLAETAPERCKVKISATILWVVISCGVVKVVCLSSTALSSGFAPIATIGDAIASFLEKRDETTEAIGPISAADVRTKRWQEMFSKRRPPVIPFRRASGRWGSVVRRRTWLFYVLFCFAIWITVLAFLLEGIHNAHDGVHSISGLWKEGLGVMNAFNTIFLDRQVHNQFNLNTANPLRSSVTGYILLANLPQTLVGVGYLAYNKILTSMILAREYGNFARVRNSLRVSQPKSEQRSTFWLQLPYRYAIPLQISMAVLHWLVARSFFLVLIDYYNDTPPLDTDLTPLDLDNTEKNLGFSPMAIILALILGGAIWLTFIAIALRKSDPGMPIAGSNSLAISAACHAGGEEDNAALKPLQYGIVHDGKRKRDSRQRVGFSAQEVTPLEDGVVYSS